MKKKLAMLAAVSLTAGVLIAGCGGSKGDTKKSDAPWKPEKDVRINTGAVTACPPNQADTLCRPSGQSE